VIFASFDFAAFLLVLLAALALLRDEGARKTLLLAASYLFYAWWDWRFCGLILASTAIDFVAARAIDRSTGPARRRWLALSVAANLGILATFKYAGFFRDTLVAAFPTLAAAIPRLDLVLPIGISFYTFQSLSYTIDVYRGRLAPTGSFRDLALFVAFFPQLVAGPIVRGREFLPQLARQHPVRASNLLRGAPIFVRGFAKKVLFADTLAVFVDTVFATPEAFSAATCWLAAFAFTAQIYYDFSGYTDMAIGVGAALGFALPENFRHPLLSRNVAEFWRRWHITLSSWMRDYLYVPLGGNRRGDLRTAVNLTTTMLLAGLWHGASWTFVVWGALHGVALIVHRFGWAARRRRAARPGSAAFARAATLLFTVLAFVVFRADSLAVAATMFQRMAGAGGGIDWFHTESVVVLGLAAALHVGTAVRRERPWTLDLRRPRHAAAAVVLLLLVLLFAPVGSGPFLYFQF